MRLTAIEPLATTFIVILFCAPPVAAQDEITLDPDSPEAKSLETMQHHALRIPSEMVQIAGGTYSGEVLSPFRIDRTLVTVRQYRACVDARVCKEPPITGNWSATYYVDDRLGNPVNEINWYNARTYCDWVGKRLPTAAEWEWVARGRDAGYTYPWGNDAPTRDSACWMRYDSETDTGSGTCPVDEPSNQSRDGVWDMAANLWEWTATFTDNSHTMAVMKGGAWYNDDPEKLKVVYSGRASLYHGDAGSDGFRCVADAN